MENLNANRNTLDHFLEECRKAQVLYTDPAWRGKPAARALVDVLSKRPDLEANLVEFLNEENQLVVAHSLLALEIMESPELGKISGKLLERKEHITIRMGSFRDKMELGAFARHVKKKSLTKHKT